MNLYQFSWKTHKWFGLALSLFLIVFAVSGFLLLQKKNSNWIQPTTQQGTAGDITDILTIPELFSVVLSQDHPDFQFPADIDRVDFRPNKYIYKVRSIFHHTELQIDAVTGEVVSSETRRSDLIEDIHDGSFFSESCHQMVMPIVAVGLLWLVISGLIIWLRPIIRRIR